MRSLTAVISMVLSLYRPRYAATLVAMLQQKQYRAWPYLRWFWNTQDFSDTGNVQAVGANWFTRVLWAGMLLQVLAGVTLAYLWYRYSFAGGLAFGLALIVSYPIVWAHLLAVLALGVHWLNIKRLGRSIVCRILERQVQELRKRHDFTIVAVAGSVGKTSTKLAIAKLLAAEKRVIYEEGNYNDRVTVPLVLFGAREPSSLFNIFAWVKLFLKNAKMLQQEYPYDVAVLELGTDGPGQLSRFAYLQPEIVVVTAVAPEHMEFFGTLDAVASEELSVAAYAKRLVLNGDDIAAQYQVTLGETVTYGMQKRSDYRATFRQNHELSGEKVTIQTPAGAELTMCIPYMGVQGVKIFLGAFAVADMLGVKRITKAVRSLLPASGRLQVLSGQHDSMLIDDTYNASPLAVKAALDVLYATTATKRIAILGSMNELGSSSAAAHVDVGAYCNPAKLDLVVTVGQDANAYLAPEAELKGCQVMTCGSPYEAGEYVKGELQPDCVVLAKGSQNGVFAEEALKLLLRDPADAVRLVRQSPAWLRKKRQQFEVVEEGERVAPA